MQNDSIKLTLIHGKSFTFSSNDYIKLRSDCRIVGKSIGIPVCYQSQRNVMWNSMPVFFNEYETRLMVEQNLVTLEKKDGLQEAPSNEMKTEFANYHKKIVLELQNPYVESRLKGIKDNMEHIIKGKRKKLLKSRTSEDGLYIKIIKKNSSIIKLVLDISLTPEDILNEESMKIRQSLGNICIYTQVPTQHPFKVASFDIKDVSVSNENKYKIFRDLWLKGFFITSGDSFGCDFLTYSGDPIYYHASQIIHVVEASQLFDLSQLIGCARLSVSVNKKCVFAYVNEDKTITYQDLHWDNPKLRQLYTSERCKNSQKNLNT